MEPIKKKKKSKPSLTPNTYKDLVKGWWNRIELFLESVEMLKRVNMLFIFDFFSVKLEAYTQSNKFQSLLRSKATH